MQALNAGDLYSDQVTRIARTLDVPAREVISMNRRLFSSDRSLNDPLRSNGEGQWQDVLIEETDSHENTIAYHEELTERKALLSRALTILNERERHIIVERRLRDNPTSFEELSRKYGISHPRLHQIEVRALEKLEKIVRKRTVPAGSLAMTSPQSRSASPSSVWSVDVRYA
jgi:RNA polymerase sigma-32 factor